ncbi:MAG: phosphoenolpyruvate carboxylase [Bacteriovoracaceae bacterium]
MKIQSDLKRLVYQSVKLLGEGLIEIHGEKIFQEIEELRLEMKALRKKEAGIVQDALDKVYQDLKTSETPELHQKAKAFALMLELINACEAAYRSHRLEGYRIKFERAPYSIIYVFTGHPTESRGQDFLKLIKQIEGLLIEALNTDFESIRDRLLYLLKIAIRINLANNRRPQVKDEMEQIFQIVLSSEILHEQINLNNLGLNISFRTWVGGDKDGHPKVGKKTMDQSLQLSRKMILNFVAKEFKAFLKEIHFIKEGDALRAEIKQFKSSLKDLAKIKRNDGKKIVEFKASFKKLKDRALSLGLNAPFISNIEKLIWIYPALVLPLEIREDSSLIHDALTNRSQPILKMLSYLKAISNGMDPKWYVRGVVISMCVSAKDILAAIKITQREFGHLAIPIVPLFEIEQGLLNATSILEEAFKKYPLKQEHKKWGNRFEVMVGYSDSSKENGVLPARLMIEENLYILEKFLLKNKLVPVFFHGSGGSTGRGGGSVLEQISWWPQSALDIYKVTIQGEMVQRNFNNHFIMRSQIGKIVEEYAHFSPQQIPHPEGVKKLSSEVKMAYQNLVRDQKFQELISSATPYDYLDLLKIGSRPVKRSGKGKFSIRAIPWILCWTQTRLLLPVWWGLGVGWKNLSNTEKKDVRSYYKNSPLMQSYIKNLGFTLAKVELGVWNFHLDKSDLNDDAKEFWKNKITVEFDLAVKFFHEISNEKDFTWYRPWLGESIYFRSSMIHPLNVIQKIALERKDHVLLRETVTGVASGMLTTG